MKVYIKIFLALIIISGFSSCEETADVDIPNNNPELVVAAFISPQDDSVRLVLSWTKPIFYTTSENYNDEFEEGATVVVSNGSSNYLLSYDNVESYYVSNVDNFKSGDKLKLRVTYDDKELISDCTIPAEPLYEVEYLGGKYANTGGGYLDYVHKVKLVCKNTQDLSYYRVKFEVKRNDFEDYNEVYSANEFIEMSNGESVEFQVNGDWDNSADSLKMYIINADESYFRYHKTALNQGETEIIFSEPGIIYNNIEGGIGVFSSFSQKNEVFFLN